MRRNKGLQQTPSVSVLSSLRTKQHMNGRWRGQSRLEHQNFAMPEGVSWCFGLSHTTLKRGRLSFFNQAMTINPDCKVHTVSHVHIPCTKINVWTLVKHMKCTTSEVMTIVPHKSFQVMYKQVIGLNAHIIVEGERIWDIVKAEHQHKQASIQHMCPSNAKLLVDPQLRL